MKKVAANGKRWFAVLLLPATLLWTALLTVSTPFSNAYSQVIQTPASEEQRRRSQADEQQRQRLAQQPKVQLQDDIQTDASAIASLPDSLPFSLPFESPCFPLHQVTLQVSAQLSDQTRFLGGSALPLDPFFFAQNYLQRYAGQCIGQSGVNLLLQRLTNLILQNGYSTTRVGVIGQDLSGGELNITLVPGVIHAIRFNDPSFYGTWRNAFPCSSGQLLNLRDLEQGLEQMKRVSNQNVEMQIVPADIPGESDVVLTIQRDKAWKLSASLDNGGAKGTGQLQAGGNFSVNNLLGLSDLFNVGVNTDADRSESQHGTNGHNLYYAIPFGYWNYSVAVSDYDYYQMIAGNNQSFISSGKSKSVDVKVNYLFERNQTQKNSGQLNLGKRWSRAFIDDTEIDVQKRNVTYVELAWMHQHYFGDAQLDVTLANRWGTPWLGGQTDPEDRPADFPTFQYTLQTIDATLNLPFQLLQQPFNYSATLHGQTSQSALYMTEQFSIGGRYTVRGFDGELTLAAERGFYLRNELSVALAGTPHAVYLGIDAGKVFGQSAQYLVGDQLAGAALGVRGTIGNFSYDLFSSWPLYRPEQFKTAIPAVGFNVTFQY